MVLLVLVGVAFGEVGRRLVEHVAAAEVFGDSDRPSAWRRRAPLAGVVVADVIQASSAMIAGVSPDPARHYLIVAGPSGCVLTLLGLSCVCTASGRGLLSAATGRRSAT